MAPFFARILPFNEKILEEVLLSWFVLLLFCFLLKSAFVGKTEIVTRDEVDMVNNKSSIQ